MEKQNVITQELAKINVTETVLAKIKKEYMPLKIQGIEDKTGYKKVHEARMDCKDLRVKTQKACKLGREEALRVQKEWIAKEKEIVGKISEVEDYLKKQEDNIDSQIEEQKIRAERLLKLPGRKEQIIGIEDYLVNIDMILNASSDLGVEDPLDDKIIMLFDDTQWNNIILQAKSYKLDSEQKKIDEQNRIAKEELVTARTNELIAVGAVTAYHPQLGRGLVKGKEGVSMEFVETASNEEWSKKVSEFKLIPAMKESVSVEFKPSSVNGRERTDEEKLFYFGGVIEDLTRPQLKTEEGKKTLAEAEEHLKQAINILRR